MRASRIALVAVAAVAIFCASFLYSSHRVQASDHQDSNTVLARPAADITDVFMFPSPNNPNNVVLVMDVNPLIPPGMGTNTFFDPAVMYQFKFTHGTNVANTPEDTVIQFQVNGTGTGQTITVYGPAAPVVTGTQSRFVSNVAGTVAYNASATLSNGIQVFAGPRADPFFFDLFQFFKILPDRNAQYHTTASQTPPPATATSFNGFAAGNPNGCSTAPAVDALSSNRFNVLSFVVELPKTLITPQSVSSVTHVWATTSTTTGS